MHRNIGVLLVVGLCLPFARAMAESKAEQEVRCNAYADKAVSQYNQAIEHSQCKINVDLVWQPSREFHYASCMKLSRSASETQITVREDTLKLCAMTPEAAATVPLPTEIKQCERSILKFCGTWTLSGGQYAASWSNNARATLTVTRFDGQSIALHRVDTADSVTAGMTADYLGDITGGKMKGKVTYTWPGHMPPVGYGTWDGSFTAAPVSSAAPAGPAQLPPPATSSTSSAPSLMPTAATNGSAAPGAVCELPAAPVNWFSDSYKRSSGQMWKLTGDVLTYTDGTDHKPVSFRVSRPAFWKRWKACTPDYVVKATRENGFWIWISDDRREARVFDILSSNVHDNYMLMVVMPPVNFVLEEEASAR
jgi:hypothetical protein